VRLVHTPNDGLAASWCAWVCREGCLLVLLRCPGGHTTVHLGRAGFRCGHTARAWLFTVPRPLADHSAGAEVTQEEIADDESERRVPRLRCRRVAPYELEPWCSSQTSRAALPPIG
jgi:hypothetical protein